MLCIEKHIAELPVSGPSHLQVETAMKKLKKYKPINIDQTSAEIIQAGCQTLLSEIYKFNNSVWNKEALYDQLKESTSLLQNGS
jgi:uncharacterized alpha-E superfamily protein